MPLLSINNLSKTYSKNNLKVLSEISFSVKKGEFVSIIGPSGCGKSTLFDIIAGVTDQTSGQIRLKGKLINNRMGKFGYMFQSPLLLPWRTVLENIILGLDIQKNPRELSRQKATAFLRQFNLSKFADFYPAALSGGMKQRISLMRTVLFQKNFLLLDEPFGALDALTRLDCQMWLIEVCRKLKPTVLFITHDVREAILLSDSIYVLSKSPGKIIKKFDVDLPRSDRFKHISSQKAVKLEQEILTFLLN